MVQHTPYD